MIVSRIQKYTIGFILIIILLSYFFFFRKTQVNPITGHKQHISLAVQEEIELGLQCAPDVAAKYGGLYSDTETQDRIKNIGQKLVAVKQVSTSPYQFDFHVLADSQTINSLSFPGGQIFITRGLLKLLKSDNELAALLSHEMGHVIARHTTEKLSEFNILKEFKDSSSTITDFSPAQISNYLSDFLEITFSKKEEGEADELGAKYLIAAGYDPNVLSPVLKRLKENLDAADYVNRHSISESRIDHLKSIIKK